MGVGKKAEKRVRLINDMRKMEVRDFFSSSRRRDSSIRKWIEGKRDNAAARCSNTQLDSSCCLFSREESADNNIEDLNLNTLVDNIVILLNS